MSARLPQHADHSFDDASLRGIASETLAVTWRDARPYAVPNPSVGAVDAVLIDAIRMAVGPYVPALLRASVRPSAQATDSTAMPVHPAEPSSIEHERTTAAASTPPRDLPWIDSFLDTSAEEAIPAAPVTFAVATPVVSIFAADVENDTLASTADAAVDDVSARALFSSAPEAEVDQAPELSASVDIEAASMNVEATVEATVEAVSEEWPLAEAGAAMEALAKGLAPESPADESAADESAGVQDPAMAESSIDADAPASAEPMPMWADDDLMDIMPVRRVRMGSEAGEPWADQVRRQGASSGAEAAASALESLARRVRDGELVLPGYSSEMGEPAALAAALAALLGVRQ